MKRLLIILPMLFLTGCGSNTTIILRDSELWIEWNTIIKCRHLDTPMRFDWCDKSFWKSDTEFECLTKNWEYSRYPKMCKITRILPN